MSSARRRQLRLIAIVTGLIGLVLCALTPLLPVKQTTAALDWPQDGTISSVTAPLISGTPLDLNITIPCTLVNDLPAEGGVLVSTNPQWGRDASRTGLFVRADADNVQVTFRDTIAALAPRAQVASGGCDTITVWANTTNVGASFNGIPGATTVLDTALRPQLTGVFTDLTGGAPAALQFTATIDTRFSSTPTALKLLAMIIGVLATIASLIALARLDRASGHRRSLIPKAWRRIGVLDGVVVGVLGVWHVIGGGTSDDGYILTMARAAEKSGYVANYYRYFGSTEAPFDWYYSVLSTLAQVSTAGIWMRLPALLAGIACWLVISREMIPRLGRAVRASNAAVWTAGLVFLAFWLPFDNGLRTEPIIALGAIVTWCAVERSIATRRLLPAAIAIIVAALTLAAAPQGVIAIAVLVSGARPVVRVFAHRRREVGTLALLAPILAAAALVLVLIFRDQTLASVAEAIRVRYQVGPTIAWSQEFLRYYFLSVPTVDGSMTRRFAVLVLLLTTFATLAVMLRRKHIAGLASGPAWRLIGSVFATMLLLNFTPTKWTVQFGIFAGLAGAVAALSTAAVRDAALRTRRNLTLFIAGLLFLLAFATSGFNAWFYTSGYGIAWFDRQPVVAGRPVTTMLLVLAVAAALFGAWQHFRQDFVKVSSEPSDTSTAAVVRRRTRFLTSTPLLIVAGLMVLFEVLSFAKGAYSRYPAFTNATANVDALTGNSCAMADDVLLESDPNSGALTPIAPADPANPLAGADSKGFTPGGVADDLEADPSLAKPGQINTDSSPNSPSVLTGQNSGTDGGRGPEGVNGSTVALPFGLDPASTPIMGSYGADSEPALLRSSWYGLPTRSEGSPLIVISAAGSIWSVDEVGEFTYGQSLLLEYGRRAPDGTVTPAGTLMPLDIGPTPSWRNLRIPIDQLPADADAVRIVAEDPNLTGDQWLAFTPPRVPTLQTLNEVIGSDNPVLLDLAVGAQFPCQRPFDSVDGVAEVPQYRILPDRKNAISSSRTWQAGKKGGPLGITESLLYAWTVPSYLDGDWYRDWGSVERLSLLIAAPTAQLRTGEAVRSGWWRPGPIRAIVD